MDRMEAEVSEESLVLLVVSVMIVGGIAVLWIAMANRRALREMEHRERIAMIQAGMVPAPEADPLAFEAWALSDLLANQVSPPK